MRKDYVKCSTICCGDVLANPAFTSRGAIARRMKTALCQLTFRVDTARPVAVREGGLPAAPHLAKRALS